MQTSRRQFLKTVVGGVTLTVSTLPGCILGAKTAHGATTSSPPGWSGVPGIARFRIDGFEKVTGRKIYARDFRPQDLDGWPDEEELVLVARTPISNRVFQGFDLSRISSILLPNRIITAEDLTKAKVGRAETDYPEGDYLLPRGKVPDYLGQAVGLLFYDDYRAMDLARRAIRSDVTAGLSFGNEMPPSAVNYYQPETSIVHVEKDGDRKVFAQVSGGPVRPQQARTERDEEALGWVDKIRERFIDPGAQGWKTISRTYETQMVDPMFMEPESGLGWFDRSTGTLHLLIGTQSPSYDATAALQVFEGTASSFGVKRVNLIAAYPGGGFGGRDTSILCLFLALSAVNANRPVRIVYDRFEQFQAGIKRHASRCEVALAVGEDKKFKALRNYIYLDGGGRRNVSGYVAQVSAINGTGPYSIPLVDIWSRAVKTQSVTAGSVRGFGAVQSQFAIETIVDEMAEKLGMDPIELRKMNVLSEGEVIGTGAPVAPPGLLEMCTKAASHPLWLDRKQIQKDRSTGDEAYGVGFAAAIKNYGTGADAALDEVAIAPDGTITVTTNVIDMGTGTATTLALATAEQLGANATRVNTGYLSPFEALHLEEGFEMQPENPRWTPLIYESTKAASTSSKWVHGVQQASNVLLETGLLPAARELWGESTLSTADVSWNEGALVSAGRTPIGLSDLAKTAHEKEFVVSAMIHAFFSGRWVEADYVVGSQTYRWQIDALSIRRGGQEQRELIDRKNPKLYTVKSVWEGNGQSFGATACLASILVNRRTGSVRLEEAVHFIGPGKVLQKDLMEGQLDGCFAMGVGMALLETTPADETGAGGGLWNLNQYHVPLSADVALGKVEKVILPPETADAPARGIAEVGMVAIPPAIANAVAHATGIRFRKLPILPEDIRSAWRG